MKKALILIGSPNENGSTAAVAGHIEKGMRDAGVEVERHFLSRMNIGFCKGCNTCNETRKCIQRDDMDVLLGGIADSDIICIGSPSYWGDVTGQLKVFFDRSTPVCDTRKGGNIVPPGKVGISFALRTGQGKAETLHLIETIEHYFGHLGIKAAERLTIEGVSGREALEGRSAELERAYDMGRRVLSHFEKEDISISLKDAGEGDVKVLAAMNRKLIRDEGSENPMTLEQLEDRMFIFIRTDYRAVLLMADNNIAGYCLYRIENIRADGGHDIYVRQYYVEPEYRRKDVGKRAFAMLREKFFKDAVYLKLDVLEGNTAGKAFWAKVGFKQYCHSLRLKNR